MLIGPFTTQEALSAGITAGQLRGRRWESPFRGVHQARDGGPADLMSRCRALAKLMPDDVVFSGITVPRLLGWWLPQGAELAPLHATVPPDCRIRRHGVRTTRRPLEITDVLEYEGLRLTVGARTLADLATDWSLVDLVVMADSALRLGACSAAELALIASRPGGRGVRTLRRVATLADRRSESAMETLLRLIYVLSSQPHPTPQVNLYDQFGDFLARGDLVGPDLRSVFEYDGADHNEPARHNADVLRWKLLTRNGFKVYPYTAVDVFREPAQIVADYQDALGLPRDPQAVQGWLREFERSSFARRPCLPFP
jgi:very-short-patch-repair endonuclease